MSSNHLPSQTPSTREDAAFERGYLAGRASALNAIERRIAAGATREEITILIADLHNVKLCL